MCIMFMLCIDLSDIRQCEFIAFVSFWTDILLSFCPLVFHRKDLCEAKHEIQSVFKFSDVPFALRSYGPP